NDGLKAVNDFLSTLGDGTSSIEKALSSVTKFYKDFTTGFGSSFDSIREKFSAVTAAFSSLGDTIGRIFGRITGRTETFGSTFGKVFGVAIEIALVLAEKIISAVDELLTGIEFVIDKIAGFISAVPKLPDDVFSGVVVVIQAMFTGVFTVISGIWEKIKALFDWSPLAIIKEKFGPIVDTISGFISGAADKAGAAWNRLTSIFSDEEPVKLAVNDPASFERATVAAKALNTALKQIAGLAEKATSILNAVNFSTQGKRMMDTLAAGMKARAYVVVDQIKATMKDVRNYLPSSPAKVGPLSDIHKLKFAETIARSIKADPMVKAMRAATLATRAAANDNQFGALSRAELSRGSVTRSNIQAQARRSASSSAGGTVINYAPTITIEGGSPDAEKRFKELLKQHSREIKKVVDDENNRVARRSYG
ncbi:MAG: hypothetical protein JKY32_08020, partial [Rhizobiales bacterium]|nr:hypothetical protein [Hyphomicrobiales bacterium]